MKSIYSDAIIKFCPTVILPLVVSVFMLPAAFTILAQTQNQAPPPLRSESHAVLISVAVRDTTGKSVDNLQKEDFTVTDNGNPRDFQMFPGDNSPGGGRPPILQTGYFSNRYAAQ